jgi:putative DNA primase/helicase
MRKNVHHDKVTVAHLEHLRRFRIPDDMIAAAGVLSVSDSDTRDLLGIHGKGGEDFSGILFPNVQGGRRVGACVRRDHRGDDGGAKYVTEQGNRHLYIPPGCEAYLQDHSVPVVLVEAITSALALRAWSLRTETPILPIAMNGCFGWKRKNGTRPTWDGNREPETGPSPTFDLIVWKGRGAAIMLDSNVATNTMVQAAQRALVAEVRGRGAIAFICTIPPIPGINGPDDLVAVTDDEAIKKIIAGREASGTRASLTDTGNAELVVEKFAGRALFCKERNEWYLADKTGRWSPDRTNRARQIVQETMLDRWNELSRNPDPKDPRLRQALRSLEHKGIRDCAAVLEFQQSLAVLPEQLDSDPILLGVENGILSLSTGELLPPRLDLLVTKCAPVRFDPTAKCDRWLEYLERVQPQEETRQFLQRLAGSFLTGLQPEQSFIFFNGVGGNGKSVFVRVSHELLGPDYAFKARKQLLFVPDRRTGEHGAQPNDIADIAGARLITSTEQVNKRWNLEFIKDYTGGEPQHARQLYHTGRNFKATGKILVSANEEPTLDEFEEAVRRRFICVPWDVIIPEKERVAPIELYISSLLRDGGRSGILNWALEGLRDLVARSWRLDPPASAIDRTRVYLQNEDRVASFFKDWFEDGAPLKSLTTNQLRKYFAAWLDEPEKFVISAKAFTKQCRRIFGSRCRPSHARFSVLDNLRLSERGQTELAEHQSDFFTKNVHQPATNDE